MLLTRDQKAEVKDLIEATIKSLLGNEGDFVKQLSDNIADKVAIKIKHIEQRVEMLEKENNYLRTKLNSTEQFSRRLNIRISGVREDNKEDVSRKVLTVLKERLKVDVNSSDIDCCYRVRRNTNRRDSSGGGDGKNRAVLVRFTSYRAKLAVMKNRKNLKGSGYVLYEDLTKDNHRLYRDCVEKLDRRRVWTKEGKVYVRVDGTVHRVKNSEHLSQINV